MLDDAATWELVEAVREELSHPVGSPRNLLRAALWRWEHAQDWAQSDPPPNGRSET